jgi:hypothetical protein
LTRALAVLVAGSLLLAALLAPVLWRTLAPMQGASPWPFSRVFDRLAILSVLLLAVLLRSSLGLVRVRDAWRAETWRQRGLAVAVGLPLAIVPALATFPAVVASTRLDWAGRTLSAAAVELLIAIPAALLVSVLEETFFRVLVFRGLAARWHPAAAALASSLLYSCVHFLQPDKSFQPTGPSPLEGLRYVFSVVARLKSAEVWPAVVGLLLVGLLLCLALHRTASLGLCIGLHAGYFAAVKVAIFLTTLGPGERGGSVVKRLLLLGSPWVWLAVALGAAAVLLIRWRR